VRCRAPVWQHLGNINIDSRRLSMPSMRYIRQAVSILVAHPGPIHARLERASKEFLQEWNVKAMSKENQLTFSRIHQELTSAETVEKSVAALSEEAACDLARDIYGLSQDAEYD